MRIIAKIIPAQGAIGNAIILKNKKLFIIKDNFDEFS